MKYHIRNFITGLLSVAIMTFVSIDITQAQDVYPNTQTEDDVVDVIQNSGEHTIFASLIEEAGMTETLRQEQDVTVIAPTDEAFEDYDELNELRQNPQEVERFVESHIKTNDQQARTDDMDRSDQQQDRKAEKDKHKDKNKEVLEASNGEVHSVDKVKDKKDKKNKDNKY